MTKSNENFISNFPIHALALILPILLVPVEAILPYPAIIEEVIKSLLVLLVIKLIRREDQMNVALLAVFFFALSENIFYLASFVTTQQLDHFAMRFVLTTSIHLMNPVLTLPLTQRNKWWIIPMTLIAMLVHHTYNLHIQHFQPLF